jgi:hypothetical protein
MKHKVDQKLTNCESHKYYNTKCDGGMELYICMSLNVDVTDIPTRTDH